jgi:hypothetical protein
MLMPAAVAPEAGEAMAEHAAPQKAVERFGDEAGHAACFAGDPGEGGSLRGDELVEPGLGGVARYVACEGAEARRRGEHALAERRRWLAEVLAETAIRVFSTVQTNSQKSS